MCLGSSSEFCMWSRCNDLAVATPANAAIETRGFEAHALAELNQPQVTLASAERYFRSQCLDPCSAGQAIQSGSSHRGGDSDHIWDGPRRTTFRQRHRHHVRHRSVHSMSLDSDPHYGPFEEIIKRALTLTRRARHRKQPVFDFL